MMINNKKLFKEVYNALKSKPEGGDIALKIIERMGNDNESCANPIYAMSMVLIENGYFTESQLQQLSSAAYARVLLEEK